MCKDSTSLGTSRNPPAPCPGVLPTQLVRHQRWDLLSSPQANEQEGLMVKLVLCLQNPGNKKKSSQDGQVSELTPHRCCSLAFNCSPGLAFIPHALQR